MGSGGRNPGRGACPKIIYERFAKIHKKMLALARIVCYDIIKKRGDKAPQKKRRDNHDERNDQRTNRLRCH